MARQIQPYGAIGLLALQIGLRNNAVVSLPGRSFQLSQARRQPFLLSRVVEIKLEQKFFSRCGPPAKVIELQPQGPGRIQLRARFSLGEVEPGVAKIIRRGALQRVTHTRGKRHEPDEVRPPAGGIAETEVPIDAHEDEVIGESVERAPGPAALFR